MKTIDEIMKAKLDIEKDIKELLSDFQTASGCRVANVNILTTSEIGQRVPQIYQVHLEVHLPRD